MADGTGGAGAAKPKGILRAPGAPKKEGLRFIEGNVWTKKLFDPRNQPWKLGLAEEFKEEPAARYPQSFARIPGHSPLYLKESGLFGNKQRISHMDPNYPHSKRMILRKLAEIVNNAASADLENKKAANPGMTAEQVRNLRRKLREKYKLEYSQQFYPTRKNIHKYISFPNAEEAVTVINEKGNPVTFPAWVIPEEKRTEHEAMKEVMRRGALPLKFNTNAEANEVARANVKGALLNKPSYFYTANNAMKHGFALPSEGNAEGNLVAGTNHGNLVAWERYGIPANVLEKERTGYVPGFNFNGEGEGEENFSEAAAAAEFGEGGEEGEENIGNMTPAEMNAYIKRGFSGSGSGAKGGRRSKKSSRVQTLKKKLRRGGRGTRRARRSKDLRIVQW